MTTTKDSWRDRCLPHSLMRSDMRWAEALRLQSILVDTAPAVGWDSDYYAIPIVNTRTLAVKHGLRHVIWRQKIVDTIVISRIWLPQSIVPIYWLFTVSSRCPYFCQELVVHIENPLTTIMNVNLYDLS